jgi:hypothetical protein
MSRWQTEYLLSWPEPKFEPEFLKTLLMPSPAEKVQCLRVSAKVNNARSEGLECLE